MPIYCKKYNFKGIYNECIYNNPIDSNFLMFYSAETFKSSDRRWNMVGEDTPLTVSSLLRCPLSFPPPLLHLPFSSAGILTKAREVHASSEGLDEAQSADEDSSNYNNLYHRACTV